MNSKRRCNSVAKCEICGKGVSTGIQVSHSHIRTKRTWSPNIQKVRALVNGTPTRLKVCTRCLRSGKITRAV
ncbi:MAG: 50S ribosomal protein L28 [Firmicutes bacterium]|nr:50S ribosomal protein L28 [Bacillota bacterium]